MLEKHKDELTDLKRDLSTILDDEDMYTPSLITLVEGRISDLESMIAIDKYWENR